MAKKIVILEDNPERRAAMNRCLQDRFYQFEIVFFEAAAPMRSFLESHLGKTIAIGLDHDLDLQIGEDGRATDAGTGREVADYLAAKNRCVWWSFTLPMVPPAMAWKWHFRTQIGKLAALSPPMIWNGFLPRGFAQSAAAIVARKNSDPLLTDGA